MTVSSSASRNQYTATAGQTVFAYTFEIVSDDDIVVLKNGVTLTKTADYTVSGVGTDSGGNVTLTSGATAGDILTLYRDMAYERTTDYTNAGDFLAADVNNDFDRLWIATQQVNEEVNRSIKAPVTDPLTIDMTIPAKADRAGNYLAFDANGNPISGAPTTGTIVGNNYVVNDFTGDGSTTVFTLTQSPGSKNNVQIYIDGVYQQKDTFSISLETLTFSEAPPDNSSIECILGDAIVSGGDANSLTYTYPAASAHTRTVQARLEESVSVKDFGAVGDGTTDDTTAIQAAIDSLPDGGTLLFNDGTFKFSTVIFDVPYGSIKGDGIIKGIIRVRAPDYLTNSNLRRLFFLIDGLTFQSGSFNAVDRGIELIDVSIGVITNCKFEGLETGIYTPVNTTTDWGQVSSRVVITNNQYNDCNYFIAGESSRTDIDYGMSDCVISHNSGVAKIDHVSLNTYDGVTISDNIFFADLSSAQSRNCVRLTNGTWAQIHDNKFFEMGEEAVRIESVTHGSIHNNVYAWPGRRVEKPALLVTGSPEGGDYFTFLNIHDEEIHRPSGVGISIGAKQGRMNIHHNLIYLPGNNDRYTGTPPLSGDTRGIVLDSDVQFINTSNNSTYGGTYTLTDGTALVLNRHDANMNEVSNVVYRTTIPVVLTLSGTETSVDVAKADVGSLAQSSATSITSLLSSTGIKTITFRAFNGNTTFVNSATLGLQGGTNVTLSSGNTITFLCYTDQAHEVARNF